MKATSGNLILIVDDDQMNLTLLDAILRPSGFKTITVDSGKKAIDFFQEIRPDLVLLDIMMPDMDGYEVCREIRKLQGDIHIPVIMVTALESIEDKEKAAEAGADDFITKPIHKTELLIRVNSLLRISSYQKRLYQKNRELEKLNAKLKQTQKSKEELIHMIVHDLKNPLTGIYGNLELLRFRKDRLDDKQSLLIDKAMVASDRMMNMIQNILDVYKLSEGKLKPRLTRVSINELINECIDLFRIAASLKGILIDVKSESHSSADIITDPDLVKRILGNLLSNAIRHSSEKEKINIDVTIDSTDILISVRDRGPGIPDEMKERIFVPFEQLQPTNEKRAVGSAGLGLTFSKMAIETLGGQIWVEDPTDGKGSVFKVKLPIRKEASVEQSRV